MSKIFTFILTCFFLVRNFVKRFSADNLNAFSAQAAFFVFISFFPFILLILTLVQYIPLSFDNLPNETFEFISQSVSDFLRGIIAEASEKSAGAVISITSVIALWSSSKSMIGIISGLNAIYRTTEKRGMIRLRITALVYTLVFIIILIVTMVLFVFGNMISDRLLSLLPSFAALTAMVMSVRWIIGFGLLVLFFMFIYSVVPERKTKFKNELPGALVSAVGWIGFSALFSFYIDNFSNYPNIYGSMTAIVLLLLWLYACMTILFVGAEINYVFRDGMLKVIRRHMRGGSADKQEISDETQ